MLTLTQIFTRLCLKLRSEDKEPGTVVEVVQEGYKIGDRLLRPALVGVSKKKTNKIII